jgi:hypothetical protein
VLGVPCAEQAFQWDATDRDDAAWYPQGLTGSFAGSEAGLVAGRVILAAAWYNRDENNPDGGENRGARVSFVDLSEPGSPRYRHVLLVEPVAGDDEDSAPGLKPVVLHAGGIAWFGSLLYVAETSKGFRVFDLDQILEIPGGDPEAFGRGADGQGYSTWGYRYVLPQVGSYRLTEDACCARFSFVAVDRSSSPPSLVAGEYTSDDDAGRLHRWPLDPSTGRLATDEGVLTANELILAGVRKMQGGLSIDGRFFISSSQPKSSWPPSPSTLYSARPGEAISAHPWPSGPEDLVYAPAADRLWSQTEHPGKRWVFAVAPEEVLEGCD